MKRTLCLLLAILLLLSLCACAAAGSGKYQYAFVHTSEDNDYFTNMAESFSESSKMLGYECIVLKPENDTAEAQVLLLEDLIEQGVKGIALNANQMDGLEAVLKKAKDAGIPVVTVGRDTSGSQLYIQPSSTDLTGQALMDAIYDLTGGEGTFAVLSGETRSSGWDPWVSGMELAARDSKFQKLIWAETNYSFNSEGSVEEMMALIVQLRQKYPDLEAICCPGPQTLLACCRAITELGADIKVTGMHFQPNEIKDVIGTNGPCPYFFTWDPRSIGACAAYALKALEDGAALQEGELLVTEQGEYTLQNGYDGHMQIIAGPPAICDQ